MTANSLSYLGVLAAPTPKGRRAVAVACAGDVEFHHIADAGLVVGNPAVNDWLLAAGISPEEAASALPVDIMVREILVPQIGAGSLVISHADREIPLVDMLVSELSAQGNAPILSGIEPTGPFAEVVNGAAGRRAFALQAAYEAAIDQARRAPAVHELDGRLNDAGQLVRVSVDGPFCRHDWTLADDDDALFVGMALMNVGPLARFSMKKGPAASALMRLASDVGMHGRLAA